MPIHVPRATRQGSGARPSLGRLVRAPLLGAPRELELRPPEARLLAVPLPLVPPVALELPVALEPLVERAELVRLWGAREPLPAVLLPERDLVVAVFATFARYLTFTCASRVTRATAPKRPGTAALLTPPTRAGRTSHGSLAAPGEECARTGATV